MTDTPDDNAKPARPRGRRTKPPTTPLVVALAASAATAESLERLLEALEPASDRAVVVVLQHQEAVEASRLEPLTAALSPIEHGAPVEGGRLYLAPPDAILTLKDGRFQLRKAKRAGQRGAIDSFLVSLADDQGERAAGVVLHGTAGDGTLGVAALKEGGGLTIAERQADEGPAELAASHSARALADFLLPVAEIPERLAAYAQHLARLRERKTFEDQIAEAAGALGQVATILRNKTGHDFHGYKPNTFLRRIQRRMQVVQIDDVEAYAAFLRADAGEVQNLFNDLLIGVTQFFRDAREFEVLEREVIPKLLDGKGAGDVVRVWVLGCATGEEAYSIAMLLREEMARRDAIPHVQIFATDIDARALAAARVGRYAASIAADVPPERLARWFYKEGDTYVIAKELREMCIFSAHNIIRDAPFSKLDLISCRNLLIYLNADLQNRVIPLFHFALLPDRFLFLGNAENVTRHQKLFAPVDRRARIFRRLDTGARVLPEFPITTARGRHSVEASRAPARAPGGDVARRAERIAERYAPAYVITDEQFDVQHFSGRTGRYLEPATGAASLNLLNLVHRDLRPTLRAALQKAAERGEAVRVERARMGLNGDRLDVDVVVEPLPDKLDAPRHFVVLFKDAAARPEAGDRSGSAFVPDEQMQRLESELRVTRDRLQATIEELESTNEELKSSNEEYQSLNEELQSANEELETSREELQSVNEELTTVNGELAHRVHELTRATSDLKNFLESTRIATLFLDNDLKVMNFTPAVSALFHLVETDVGRPIAHIKARVPTDALLDDVRRVLRTLASVEREIENPATGARYIVRVLPYRSVENYIAGAVVTFVNVTALTQAERALRDSEARQRALIEGIPQLVWRAVDGGHWTWSSPQWTAYTGLSEEASRGHGWLEAVHPDDRVRAMDAWREAERTGALAVEYRVLHTGEARHRWVQTRATPLRDEEGRTQEWLGTSTDVDELRRLQEHQRFLLAELQHRVRNTLSVVRSIARRTAETSDSIEDYAMHLDGRINAFARVQAAVTRDPTGGVDLAQIIGDELLSYAAREGEQARVSGPPIRLQPKAAETLGLAIHELVTNAVKHGAFSTPNGRIAVTWRIETDGAGPRLVFAWRESGLPMPAAPKRRGFGTDLLERTLAYELQAKTVQAFESDGLRCTIELPLTERIALGGFGAARPGS